MNADAKARKKHGDMRLHFADIDRALQWCYWQAPEKDFKTQRSVQNIHAFRFCGKVSINNRLFFSYFVIAKSVDVSKLLYL